MISKRMLHQQTSCDKDDSVLVHMQSKYCSMRWKNASLSKSVLLQERQAMRDEMVKLELLLQAQHDKMVRLPCSTPIM